MKRSFLNKDIGKQVEIIMLTKVGVYLKTLKLLLVEKLIERIAIKPTSDLAEKAVSKPIDFTLTPDTLNNIKDV